MIAFRSATVVFNPKKEWASGVASEVTAFLKHKRVLVGKNGEFVVAVGGDGTVLYNKDIYQQPIFGVGSKHSFICSANKENWKSVLGRVLAGAYRMEGRSTLAVEMDGRKLEDALNEVALRAREQKLVDFRLFVGKRRFEFRADGVVFATPTGSTAYAYSCGGRRLGLKERKFEIVAIAPYLRKFKPLVVSDSESARLFVDSVVPMDCVIDGQSAHGVIGKSEIKVYKSGKVVVLLKAK